MGAEEVRIEPHAQPLPAVAPGVAAPGGAGLGALTNATQVLALQRTAGNASVARYLAQGGGSTARLAGRSAGVAPPSRRLQRDPTGDGTDQRPIPREGFPAGRSSPEDAADFLTPEEVVERDEAQGDPARGQRPRGTAVYGGPGDESPSYRMLIDFQQAQKPDGAGKPETSTPRGTRAESVKYYKAEKRVRDRQFREQLYVELADGKSSARTWWEIPTQIEAHDAQRPLVLEQHKAFIARRRKEAIMALWGGPFANPQPTQVGIPNHFCAKIDKAHDAGTMTADQAHIVTTHLRQSMWEPLLALQAADAKWCEAVGKKMDTMFKLWTGIAAGFGLEAGSGDLIDVTKTEGMPGNITGVVTEAQKATTQLDKERQKQKEDDPKMLATEIKTKLESTISQIAKLI